jgi:hypothetical protein
MSFTITHKNGYVAPASESIADVGRRSGKGKIGLAAPPEDMTPAKAPKVQPVEKSETYQITGRIRELEAKAADQAKAKAQAQGKLSETIAAGNDATADVKALAAASDALSATVGALRMLDSKLVETSTRERAEAIDALRIDAENKFRELVCESHKAVQTMTDKLGKILGEEHAVKVSSQITEAMTAAAWQAANERFDADYIHYVPAIVKATPRRNDDGSIATEPVRSIIR